MHRSLYYRLWKRRLDLKGVCSSSSGQNQSPPADGIQRCSIKACNQQLTMPPSCSTVFINSFHTTTSLSDEVEDSNNSAKDVPKRRSTRINNELKKDEDELHTAAIDAAKSLPGDWTKIADELVSRLSSQQKVPEDVGNDQTQTPVSSSLLSSMKVSRNFQGVQRRSSDSRDFSRKPVEFRSFYNQPRLGIFNAAKLKAKAGKSTSYEDEGLWEIVTKERTEQQKGRLPRNGFEEMIQWTKEGRMWTFPINNEEDMHEERQYKFHEHVFLYGHLKDFPTEGPLRRFMDLVVIGLSNNPWISVPEKVEHIRWYADYFRQKQNLLKSSIGDKAKMKQS